MSALHTLERIHCDGHVFYRLRVEGGWLYERWVEGAVALVFVPDLAPERDQGEDDGSLNQQRDVGPVHEE